MPHRQAPEDLETILTVPIFLAAGTLAAMVALSQTKAILPGTSEKSVGKLPSCVAPSVMLSLVEVVREMRMRLRSVVTTTTATTITIMTLTTSRQMAMLGLRILQFDTRPHRARYVGADSTGTQDNYLATDEEAFDRSE